MDILDDATFLVAQWRRDFGLPLTTQAVQELTTRIRELCERAVMHTAAERALGMQVSIRLAQLLAEIRAYFQEEPEEDHGHANQLDSGQNRLGPSPTRWKDRSRTYQGIADAMASQWEVTDASA